MADFSSDIRALVVTSVERIRAGIVQNMSAQGRTTSGASVQSLLTVPDKSAIGATLMGAPQWAVMQHGRKPGKVPSNFREIIKEWAKRKGISIQARQGQSQESALNSFSYLVARSIMRNGTKLYRDKGYNDIFDTLIEQEAEKLAQDAQGLLSVEIDKINDKKLK